MEGKKKYSRLEIRDKILEKLQSGGEYTYNQLRVLGASTGLVSTIIHQHLQKQCSLRTVVNGNELWQQTTYISLLPQPPKTITS